MIMIKIGLLPLFLKLYDEHVPQVRESVEPFVEIVEKELISDGFDVSRGSICRIESEFASVIEEFENQSVDAIVTLHLAYSPSLESIKVLSKTNIPIIVLDTTPDFEFGMKTEPDRLMLNHGIHGVQDMCNMLLRHEKPFLIEAGHWKESTIFERLSVALKAAKLAAGMRRAKVGLIGDQFKGMGDFAVPFETLKSRLGVKVVESEDHRMTEYADMISSSDIHEEIEKILSQTLSTSSDDALRRTVESSLITRKWLEQEKLTAFTQNFLSFDGNGPMKTVPFLECATAMRRGIGYAGEGDVLTASLVGALLGVFPETTFTEIFCPDWKNNRLFMSHMGEANPALLDDLKIVEYNFPFTPAENPAKFAGRLKPGPATLVNLAPTKGDHFSLIVSEMDVCPAPDGEDSFSESIRGWLKPQIPLHEFLEQYSRAGGTHHKALVYGKHTDILEKFAALMNWNFISLG